MKLNVIIVLLCGLVATGWSATADISSPALKGVQIEQTWRSAPLHFEANQGQTDCDAEFLARSVAHTVFLTRSEVVLAFAGGVAPVRLRLVGANPQTELHGLEPLPGKVAYYRGHDSSSWQEDVPLFAKVQYAAVYPGVDLVYYGNDRQLECDFVVAPGARPDVVRLALDGVEKAELDGQGNLVLKTAAGRLAWNKPHVYQELDGQRQPVAGEFVLHGEREVGFHVAAYDARRPLVIDPTFVYSTYLGGSGEESEAMLWFDATGNAFVFGQTRSVDFPGSRSPLGPGGDLDMFLTKIGPTGSLIFSERIGGSGTDEGSAEVDTNGNIFVFGTTSSTDFPVLNAAQSTYGGGSNDVFLMKFNNSGTLQFSTYLGGSGGETVSLDLDSSRTQVYLSGQTTSMNFPTHSGYQSSYGGGAHDFYVAKYNASGALQYSTLLGGNGDDDGTAHVNADGTVIVIGTTSSSNFPVTGGAYQGTYGGSNDVFVTKINASGNGLLYSTYLGGSGAETASGGTVDSAGNAYVCGHTTSSDFPTMNAVQSTYGGGGSNPFLPGGDVFVAKLNSSGSITFATYLGGSGDEQGTMQLDNSGNIYVIGQTASSDFPMHNAAQSTYGGPSSSYLYLGDVFLTKLTPAGQFVYSTYLGGSGIEETGILELDSSGNALVWGMTASDDFPTMNAAQPTFGGGSMDMFITKFNASGVMQFSTYLGGSGDEIGDVIWDTSAGVIYAGGMTSSTDFPTTAGVAQTTYGGGDHDLFAVKYNNNGQILWSTLVGGSGDETGYLIPDFTSGGVYGVGETTSTDFPQVNNSALQSGYGGGSNDLYVVRLDSSGKFVYSTYLGGSGTETGFGIPDGAGHLYVCGETTSPNFPLANALQGTYGGAQDVFVVKINEGGTVTCSYGLSASSTNVSTSAASGSVGVTTSSGCHWTASTTNSWIHTSSSGTGNGTVSFTVDANSSTNSRSGSITVQSQTFTVAQTGLGCSYALSASSTNVSYNAASGSFGVTTSNGCAWVASTTNSWLHTSSSGTGNGTVSYTVDASSSTNSRSGNITVQNQTFTINQAGQSCAYALYAASTNVSASASSGSFGVTATAGCVWTATTTNSWLHTSSSGTGSGTVSFTVDANSNTNSRSGNITVGAQLFTINQAGLGCAYALSASSTNVSASAASGSVIVTTSSGCSWTASTTNSWLHTSSNGTGNGTVSYTVDANTGSGRIGTLTVAGQTFTVTQAGATAATPHDLAVLSIKPPKKITLTSKKPSITSSVTVQIQNRGPASEVISNATVLGNAVTLSVESVTNTCSGLTPTLVPPTKFPITLKSKAKLTVAFQVTFSTNCVPDSLASTKTAPHNDYRYIATVYTEPIDGTADSFTADDTCPHGPLGSVPYGTGTTVDKGCGGKNPDGTLGADVLTDVIVK
ncbi:MAG: BACON domain-containing carbohydrate-binding protein [Verrucomicrobiia bacterium]